MKFNNYSTKSSFQFRVEGLKATSYKVTTSSKNPLNAVVSEPFYFDFLCIDQYGNLAEVS